MLSERHAKEMEQATDAAALHYKHQEERDAWDRFFVLAEQRDQPVETPNAYTCQMTMEVFREPFVTPSGFSYEQTALMEHFEKVGQFDPVSRKPCSPSDVVQNLALRAATQNYLDEHPWAWKECM